MSDTLQKLIFEHADVRAEFVELQQCWQQIRANHYYPEPVEKLMGEMLAAATLLSTNIKFDGAMVLQIQGDGPIRLLVVECDSELHMRATAKLNEHIAIKPEATLSDLINANGNGRFVITLDPHNRQPGQQPYQGIVSLAGKNLSEIIENYMLRSEQLDTRIWLASDQTTIRGILLQKLPAAVGNDGLSQAPSDEQWHEITALADTLKAEEMIEQPIDVLRHRLFWQYDMRLLSTVHPSFRCSCSREKVSQMLKMLGQKEVFEALAEQGQLTINCDFCSHQYNFNEQQCRALFDQTNPSEHESIH